MNRQLLLFGVLGLGLAVAALVFIWLPGAEPAKTLQPDNKSVVALGETVYRSHCAECHGKTGQPAAFTSVFDPPPRDLRIENNKHSSSFEQIVQTITDGTDSNMLRFKERLSKEQIKAVAEYVMSLRKSADEISPKAQHEFLK